MQNISSTFPPDIKLESLIAQNMPNIRSAFISILFLHSKGRAQEVALIYEKFIKKSDKNPHIKAQYAFAHFVGTVLFQDKPTPQQSKVVSYLLSDVSLLPCNQLRKESLSELPKSPEAKIMAAMYYRYNAKWKTAFDLSNQSIKLDPKWGYGYYLRGQSARAQNNTIKNNSIKINNANTAIHDFDKAEKLNPELKYQNLYIEYVNAYSDLGDYKSALAYMDKFLGIAKKREDSPRKIQELSTWRQSIASQIKP
ncbi:hypothetical protein [Armatimonas sp.]|uniref:tetratricopeptide repeat protein n=1 Tax=Armatimonas sp. TaxID=1872638 RepID=UPI00286A43E3|nr:hypothetical protein [Armatimonas sp.]